MIKIRVGGVPEHFNHPWHLAINENLFSGLGIEIEWITYSGGTGAMTQALRNNEVDVCIVLTEGIIKEIIDGNPSKIVSHYVDSPLVWGIYSGIENSLSNPQKIFSKSIAISRIGSGSHLMPQIHSHASGEEIMASQFKVVNNLEGAINSLAKLETDVFYWEKFTTKPLVDKGLFKKISEFTPPWPCFVVVGTNSIIDSHGEELKQVLNIIQKRAAEFAKHSENVKVISRNYKFQEKDAKEWLSAVKWSLSPKVNYEMLEGVLHELEKCNMLENSAKINVDQLIFEL